MSSTIAPTSSLPFDPTNPTQPQPHQQPHPEQLPPSSEPDGLLPLEISSDISVFKLNQGYSNCGIIYCVLQTVFFVGRALSVSVDGVPFAMRLISYVTLLVLPLMQGLYFYLSKQYKHSNTLTVEGKGIILIGNINLILQAVFTGAILLAWVTTRHHCHSEVCLQDYPKKLLPIRYFAYLLTSSIGMPLFFTSHDFSISLISACISIAAMFLGALVLHVDSFDILAILISGITVLFILYSIEGAIYLAFTSYSKFETALRANIASENKEYLMNIQTEEMRHMIGM